MASVDELDDEGPHGDLQVSPVDGEPVGTPDGRIAWLAGEIVEQWKAETAHRHRTIDGLRSIDEQSMTSYYEGEKRGQWLAFLVFLAVVAVAVVAIALDQASVGIAAIVTGGASAIWAMRRRSDGPSQAKDLSGAPDKADE